MKKKSVDHWVAFLRKKRLEWTLANTALRTAVKN